MDILKTYSKDGVAQYSTSFMFKGTKMEYFIGGEGWKKTKKYEIVEVDQMWNDAITYAAFAYQFGDDVAQQLTGVSMFAHSYVTIANTIFAALLELGFPDIPVKFLDVLSFDRKLACLGYVFLDVFALDIALGTPDGTSTYERIVKLYGQPAVDFVLYLLGEQK